MATFSNVSTKLHHLSGGFKQKKISFNVALIMHIFFLSKSVKKPLYKPDRQLCIGKDQLIYIG